MRLADADRPPGGADPDRRRGCDLPGRARRPAARVVPVPGPARRAAPPARGQVLAVPAVPAAGRAGAADRAGGLARPGREFAALAGYPLIAKLTTPWRAAGSGRAPRCAAPRSCASQSELDAIVAACERGGAGLMLQEYVPGGPGERLVLPRLLRRRLGEPGGLHRGQGALLPGARRADQHGPGCPQRRAARRASPPSWPGCPTAASSTWTCAWTRGPGSTSCSTSTRGSAPSSGSSATRPGWTWCSPPTWT